MSRMNDLLIEAEESNMLNGMLNSELIYQIERIEEILADKIDRAKYYKENVTLNFLEEIRADLKQIRDRYQSS